MSIKLPTKDKKGNFYISYSQIKLWKDVKGYNTGRPGKEEYIRSYFLGEKYPDIGYGQFGSDVEDYICQKIGADKFGADERAVMDKITPLGVFQHEIKIPFDGFYLKGYIDDASPDFKKLRDYKTASEKSSQKYYEPEYNQLDIYGLATLEEFGYLPDSMEVVCIEREGNAFRGGRVALRVAKEIWYIPCNTNTEKIELLRKEIVTTVNEISDYYKVFLKLNK